MSIQSAPSLLAQARAENRADNVRPHPRGGPALNRAGRCGRIGAMQDTPRDLPAKLPPLPVGNSDWAAVKAGCGSADKTQLVSGTVDRSDS